VSSETDYRSKIYRSYASQFQGATERFDESAAVRWGLPYKHYLRGWLPASQQAAILDVGCGNGRLLHFFKQSGYSNLTGVDISGEQVALARQVVPNVTEGNCIDVLRGAPESFDLIAGLDIIEHLKKDEAIDLLDGCIKALRPGGRLILQTPNADSPWFGSIRYGDFTHENCFNAHSLGKLLQLRGFTQVEARPAGPVSHGIPSFIRSAAWQLTVLGCKTWNFVEVGSPGSGIFTRVFFASGRRA